MLNLTLNPSPATGDGLEQSNLSRFQFPSPLGGEGLGVRFPTASALPVDSFSNACRQYMTDHHQRPEGPGLVAFGMSRVLGQTFMRRLSNLGSYLGLSQLYPALREYPILSPCDEIATRFQPRLFTINQDQSQDVGLRPNQLRYEILPPQQDKNFYSIVYYVGLPTEKLPIPVIGKLYDWIRPVLFGSQHDWEGIQVDVDKATLEPIGLSFETANYSNAPDSYNLVGRKDLHLFAKISKNPDNTWSYTVQQQNGQIQTSPAQNPFRDGPRANLSIVSWNTSLDTCDRVAQNSALTLYPTDDLNVQFMDIDTFRSEGIDLRAPWLMKRKLGKFNLTLPSRFAQAAQS